jgi:putative phosphoesterase
MPMTSSSKLIGVISDTHGRLPRAAVKVFGKVDLIIHAGDIGEPDILKTLEMIAPTKAVRGNMDSGSWALKLPKNEVIKIERVLLYVLHDVNGLNVQPDSTPYDAVISGHTHRPAVEKKHGVLYINPGSAVQPRFGYPPSVALLRIKNNAIHTRLIELKK